MFHIFWCINITLLNINMDRVQYTTIDNDKNDMVVPLPIVDGSPNRINQTKILNEKKDDTFLYHFSYYIMDMTSQNNYAFITFNITLGMSFSGNCQGP